jgi:hypothetical protein
MAVHDDYLDQPVWEADGIARVIGLADPDGTVSEGIRRRIYDLIKRGLLDADKLGKHHVSTPRRLLRSFRAGYEVIENSPV